MDKADLKKAMQDAQELQLGLLKTQEELENLELEVQSSNKLVRVFVNAQGVVKDIKINPTLLQEEHKIIEASILEAVQKSAQEAAKLIKERLAVLSSKVGIK